MATRVKIVTAAVVRDYLREQGETMPERGRLSESQIKRFNDAHKGSMRHERGAEKMIDLSVRVKSAKSGKVRREKRAFPVSTVRAAVNKANVRGRLSATDLERAAEALSA